MSGCRRGRVVLCIIRSLAASDFFEKSLSKFVFWRLRQAHSGGTGKGKSQLWLITVYCSCSDWVPCGAQSDEHFH